MILVHIRYERHEEGVHVLIHKTKRKFEFYFPAL